MSGGFQFASLSLGTWHTCGISTDGRAYCWGLNGSGQLGNGTTQDANVPTPVLDR